MLRKASEALGLALLLSSCLTISSFAQSGEMVDRVIATVNDEIILESEVLQYVQDIVIRNRSQYTDPSQIEALRGQVLGELISQKILLAVAEDDTNIVVEDREVNQTLDERINQVIEDLGSEERLTQYYGKPIRQIRREFRKQVREGLMVERVRNQKLMGITVSRPEVESFYAQYAREFPNLPPRVHIGHILRKIEPTEEAKENAFARADSAYNRLLLGDDFDQLAIGLSDDRASGAKGGLLGTTQRGDLVPEFEEIAFGLEEGEISSPVISRFGYHIIRLNWRRGEKINTSHILFNLTPTKADEQRAVEMISTIHSRIENGEPFEQLAREYSQDEESAASGGDLGWFDLPNMPEDFKLVVKDLSTGETSPPFKTRFGIHILNLSGREEEREFDLQRDWERISRMALVDKQEVIYREWVEEIRDQVFIEILSE